jgi:hypothetical protein
VGGATVGGTEVFVGAGGRVGVLLGRSCRLSVARGINVWVEVGGTGVLVGVSVLVLVGNTSGVQSSRRESVGWLCVLCRTIGLSMVFIPVRRISLQFDVNSNGTRAPTMTTMNNIKSTTRLLILITLPSPRSHDCTCSRSVLQRDSPN